MKRLIAMLAVTLVLVGTIAFTDTRYGTRNDGLYYQVTDIRPDARLMHVNGEPVCAEEYLYWLSSVCDYLYSYTEGTIDFNAALTDEMTYGQYAKSDAAQTVVLYAVVRQMAAEAGVALTGDDLTALEEQRAQYVSYYGGEEAYLQQLQLLGISEEMLHDIESVSYLYGHLLQTYCAEDGALRPDEEELLTFGTENNYVTAQLLYFPTTGLEAAAVEEMRAKAESYVQRWLGESDKTAAYLTMCGELQLDADEAGLTFEPNSSDPVVCDAVAELSEGAISGVIEGESGFYAARRLALNTDALTQDLFNILLQEKQDSAKVEYSKKLYDSIDAGAFHSTLNTARTALQQEMTLQQQADTAQ